MPNLLHTKGVEEMKVTDIAGILALRIVRIDFDSQENDISRAISAMAAILGAVAKKAVTGVGAPS